MAKAKRTKLRASHAKPYQRAGKADPKLATSSNKTVKHNKHSKPAPLPAPTIPFLPADHVLLVGEGDFSFSRSLLGTHGCSSLVATSFDTQTALWAKYPQAAFHIRALEEEDCKVLYGVDATKLGKPGTLDGGGRDVKRGGFNKVVFNFPHVGGLTKDVNRQVRHNQGM
jgi:25S rRNA (uracil2634-N3)-methyltransferase